MAAIYNAPWLDVWGEPIKLKWFETYAWLPKRSSHSGEWIWFERYYYSWKKHPATYAHDADIEKIKLTSEEYVWHKLQETN